jgi:predicted nucleic-acid-binding protein
MYIFMFPYVPKGFLVLEKQQDIRNKKIKQYNNSKRYFLMELSFQEGKKMYIHKICSMLESDKVY